MCLTNYLNILVLELLQTHQNMSPAEVITFSQVPSGNMEILKEFAFSQVPSGNMEILKEFAFSQVPSGNMEILKEFAFTRITQTQLSNYSQKVLNNLNHLYYL